MEKVGEFLYLNCVKKNEYSDFLKCEYIHDFVFQFERSLKEWLIIEKHYKCSKCCVKRIDTFEQT